MHLTSPHTNLAFSPMVLSCIAALALSSQAQAQAPEPLEEGTVAASSPTASRLDLGLTSEASIAPATRHTISGGLKAEYHLTKLLSVGAVGYLGKSFNTRETDREIAGLMADRNGPEPSRAQFQGHLNSMPMHGAAYLGVTPWAGELKGKSGFLVDLDVHFQGGLALASLASNCTSSVCNDAHPGGDSIADPAVFPDDNPNNDPTTNDGLRAGLYLGVGMRLGLSDYLALDLTMRDYAFSDNPSGLDLNNDNALTVADNQFRHHLFVGLGVSLRLPKEDSDRR